MTAGALSPACPSCFGALPEAFVSGVQNCAYCSLQFEAFRGNPVRNETAVSTLTADGSSPCAEHEGNAAEATCGRCGKMLCGLCRIDSDGMTLCPGCFERLASEGALPSAVRRVKDHLVKARSYTLVSWLMYPFSAILGPWAFYLAIRALIERRRRGEAGAGQAALLALLSLVSTGLGWVLIWAIAK